MGARLLGTTPAELAALTREILDGSLPPGATLSGTCQRFGVSRTTGYRWWRRYATTGSLASVVAHSRRPQHSPARTSVAVTARVIALRQ